MDSRILQDDSCSDWEHKFELQTTWLDFLVNTRIIITVALVPYRFSFPCAAFVLLYKKSLFPSFFLVVVLTGFRDSYWFSTNTNSVVVLFHVQVIISFPKPIVQLACEMKHDRKMFLWLQANTKIFLLIVPILFGNGCLEESWPILVVLFLLTYAITCRGKSDDEWFVSSWRRSGTGFSGWLLQVANQIKGTFLDVLVHSHKSTGKWFSLILFVRCHLGAQEWLIFIDFQFPIQWTSTNKTKGTNLWTWFCLFVFVRSRALYDQ